MPNTHQVSTHFYNKNRIPTLTLSTKCKKKKNIYIYIYCEAKGSRDSGPFSIKPKAHAEEEEVPEDEQKIGRAHV